MTGLTRFTFAIAWLSAGGAFVALWAGNTEALGRFAIASVAASFVLVAIAIYQARSAHHG